VNISENSEVDKSDNEDFSTAARVQECVFACWAAAAHCWATGEEDAVRKVAGTAKGQSGSQSCFILSQ
jgi:hypothetical protein